MEEFINELKTVLEKHNKLGKVKADINAFHGTVDIPGIEGDKEGQDLRIQGPIATINITSKDLLYPERLRAAITTKCATEIVREQTAEKEQPRKEPSKPRSKKSKR